MHLANEGANTLKKKGNRFITTLRDSEDGDEIFHVFLLTHLTTLLLILRKYIKLLEFNDHGYLMRYIKHFSKYETLKGG